MFSLPSAVPPDVLLEGWQTIQEKAKAETPFKGPCLRGNQQARCYENLHLRGDNGSRPVLQHFGKHADSIHLQRAAQSSVHARQ